MPLSSACHDRCIVCGKPSTAEPDSTLCQDCVAVAEDDDIELSDNEQTMATPPQCANCDNSGLPQSELGGITLCVRCVTTQRYYDNTLSTAELSQTQDNKGPKFSSPIKPMQGKTLLSSPLTALILQAAIQKSTDTVVLSPRSQEQLEYKAQSFGANQSSPLARFAGRKHQRQPKLERKRKLKEDLEEDDDVTVCADSEISDEDGTLCADSEADQISSDPKPRVSKQSLNLGDQGMNIPKAPENSSREMARVPADEVTKSPAKKQKTDPSIENDDPETKAQEEDFETGWDINASDWDELDACFGLDVGDIGFNADFWSALSSSGCGGDARLLRSWTTLGYQESRERR